MMKNTRLLILILLVLAAIIPSAYALDAPLSVILLSAHDSGIPGDNITNVKTPSIEINAPMQGFVIDFMRVYVNGSYIGDAIPISNDVHLFTFSEGQMSEGSNSVTVRRFDGAEESADSPPLVIILDTIGPVIISSAPDNPVNSGVGPLSSVTVTFNEDIDVSGSFSVDDVRITGPQGNITPAGISGLGNNEYEISFASQSSAGTYTLIVGPDISDLTGNMMDQDVDGIGGETSEDIFIFNVSIYNFDDGLVAYYPFNGNARDESGNGNDGTVHSATLTADRIGNLDSAFSFDGVNNYIDIGNRDNLKVPLPVTISAWVKVRGSESRTVFANNFDENWYFGVWMGIDLNQQLIASSYGDGGGTSPPSRRSKHANAALIQGQWYHLAAVIRSALDMDIYVDGVDVGGYYEGSGGPLVYSSNGTGTIGKWDSSGSYPPHYFAGDIDDIYFYDRALSTSEIQKLHGESINYYCDNDSDGFIDAVSDGICTGPNCSPPGCQIASGNDCNDNDETIHPGADELCDGIDNNCDGNIDEGFDQDDDTKADCFDNCPNIPNTDQADADGDGIGDACEDVTPPDTIFTSGPSDYGKVCDADVNLCWEGTDDFSAVADLQYSFNIDNGLWSDWSTETCHVFDALADGLHTVLVKAKDSSGNTDETPADLNFSVDVISPALSNLSLSYRDDTATITWNTSESATAQIEYGETAAYGMSSTLDTTMTGEHTVTIEGLTPKTMYYYRVKSNDGCHETVSRDLTFTTTDILYPNLYVTQIDMPVTVKALEQITFKWLVRNDGPGFAHGDWVDKVFLSIDAVPDSQDTLLGEYNFSDGIDWSSERWRSSTLDMPAMPTGAYYVIVQTDADNGINESDENDNTLTKQIDYLKVKQLGAAPDQIAVQLVPGEVKSGSIDLINFGDTALTGITATVQGNSPNISIQAAPPSTLDGKTVQKVSYSVTASDNSVVSNSPVLMFASAEGQTAAVTFNITVNPGHPNLVSNPGYLEQTMLRGAQTFVEFEVMNNGSAAVSNLKINLPSTDWLSLVTPGSISSLGRGEKIKVVLSLKPRADLPLGPYTGNLSLSAANAGANVNFRFTAVSDKTGGLKITAKDEFTYFAADHPPVSGAAVKISDPYNGTLITEGMTDADGQFIYNNLFEGLYSIEVRAEKHGTFNAIVKIAPGLTRNVTAFLPRQLVTYTWKVVPVQTDDKYIVTLEAEFETRVYAPVITVEPTILDLSKLQYDADGKAVVNYTVTNHGLIAANGATIRFGSHPDYEMRALSGENIGGVPAMTSIIIPVEVSKLTSINASSFSKFATTSSTNPSSKCGIPVVVGYYYVCENNQWRLVTAYAVTNTCPPSATPLIFPKDPHYEYFVNNPFGSNGGGNGLSPGGGWRGWGVMISAPSITENIDCVPPDCRDECCDKAYAGNPGVTTCCNSTLTMCVKDAKDFGAPTNISNNIMRSCVIEHERKHMDNAIGCPRQYNECENGAPYFRLTRECNECEAYKVLIKCLEKSKVQCNAETDADSIKECESYIDNKITEDTQKCNSNCITCNGTPCL